MEPCIQEKELARFDVRLTALEEVVANLKEGHTETKIYIKMVLDAMAELKQQMKGIMTDLQNRPIETAKAIETASKAWSPIVLELIKTIVLIAGIVAGIKLL